MRQALWLSGCLRPEGLELAREVRVELFRPGLAAFWAGLAVQCVLPPGPQLLHLQTMKLQVSCLHSFIIGTSCIRGLGRTPKVLNCLAIVLVDVFLDHLRLLSRGTAPTRGREQR